MKHDFSRAYFANVLKALKGDMRDACDIYGFILKVALQNYFKSLMILMFRW